MSLVFAAAANMCLKGTHQRKEKGELSAALYNVQKASLESPSAAQCQEERCGKEENTACCTFSSLCDLDTFYYFKHLIVLFKTSYNYSVL